MALRRNLPLCLVIVVAGAVAALGDESPDADHDGTAGAGAAAPQVRLGGRPQVGVYKTRITPHWSADGNRFWYVNELRGGGREYVLVDALGGERKPAFDHPRLAKALTDAGAAQVQAERLNLEQFRFTADGGAITFRAAGKAWRCDLGAYALTPDEGRHADTASASTAIHPDDAPRASSRTGAETELRFVNQTGAEVRLMWLDAEGNRQSYGGLAPGEKRNQHTYSGHVWLAIDAQGKPLAAFVATESAADAEISRRDIPRQAGGRRRNPRPSRSDTSPDGQWRAFVRGGNVYVRSAERQEGPETQLTEDGTEKAGYGLFEWAPDSQTLVAFLIEPGDRKEVFRVESSPRGGGRAVLHRNAYDLPGDKLPSYQPHLFRREQAAAQTEAAGDQKNAAAWKRITPQVERVDLDQPRLRWKTDGSAFRFTKIDRGHQRLRIMEIDARTGEARNIVDERTETFIWTAHTEEIDSPRETWLEQTDELLYASEVDGWRHLYLIDPAAKIPPDSGEPAPRVVAGGRRLFAPGLKSQITKGAWVVRGVEEIDERRRRIWFRASGVYPEQNPYLIHHGHVGFDGSGLVFVTAGNGDHALQFSPDRRFVIDTYSRVDTPPVHELRRTEDGKLLRTLEEADIAELRETGWRPPEAFVAKGRDGATDIWGIICRPRDFDPAKKYPVLEDIYAGPQSSYVPRGFSAAERYQALTKLGFIVVKIDGMGTANRSKSFHDVCWRNLKDAGFPDRILWMKAAAARRPEMDLSRVGVYGGSAGGQNAAGAVLFHPEFYQVAVAGCGCHDNRMDKASWNEQWMGYPVGPHYGESSNIDNAHRLQGKLLLIVGELDNNVPPESTLRFADALIKANKDFELLVVPGAGHGLGGPYGERRMHEFFVRHLLGATTQPAAK